MDNANPTLFKPASIEQCYLKAGIFGFTGSGKTRTATEIAVGLHKHIGSKKPVCFLDSETGSDYVKHLYDKDGIPLLVSKTRAFKSLTEALREAQKAADILIIDSITHFWQELMSAYVKTKNDGTRFIRLQDWGPLKATWQAGFAELYINSPLHVVMCGRAANVFEDVEDETTESGKKLFKAVKVGTKMRSESETGYESSLLLEMEKVYLGDHGKYARRCYVIKDRFDVVDSKEFDNPTFECFLPHVTMLNLGGRHFGVDTEANSESLFDNRKLEGVAAQRRAKEILLAEIKGVLDRAFPGATGEDRKARIDLLFKAFGKHSKEAIEEMDIGKLREGMAVIQRETKKREKVPGGKR